MATTNSFKVAAETLKGLRPDGRLVLIGMSDDSFVIANPLKVMENRLQIIGSNQNSREYLYEPLDYVVKGEVKVMEETFSLDDAADAYEKMASGKVTFPCCHYSLVKINHHRQIRAGESVMD